MYENTKLFQLPNSRYFELLPFNVSQNAVHCQRSQRNDIANLTTTIMLVCYAHKSGQQVEKEQIRIRGSE